MLRACERQLPATDVAVCAARTWLAVAPGPSILVPPESLRIGVRPDSGAGPSRRVQYSPTSKLHLRPPSPGREQEQSHGHFAPDRAHPKSVIMPLAIDPSEVPFAGGAPTAKRSRSLGIHPCPGKPKSTGRGGSERSDHPGKQAPTRGKRPRPIRVRGPVAHRKAAPPDVAADFDPGSKQDSRKRPERHVSDPVFARRDQPVFAKQVQTFKPAATGSPAAVSAPAELQSATKRRPIIRQRPIPAIPICSRRLISLQKREAPPSRTAISAPRTRCRGWCGRTESNRRDLLGRQEFYH